VVKFIDSKEALMLVLSRKVDERIQIGDEITITIVRIGPANIRIGIEAPPHLEILRGELLGNEPMRSLAGVERART
jgi:carbon storage regulator